MHFVFGMVHGSASCLCPWHCASSQVVIAANSGLVGKTVVDAEVRKKYKATVVAYQRDGYVAPTDIRHLVLQPGDVLLLNSSEKWLDKHRSDRNFVLINSVPNSAPPKKNRALIAAFLGMSMVLTQVCGTLQCKNIAS
jgi:di/tricarboxylate transporter